MERALIALLLGSSSITNLIGTSLSWSIKNQHPSYPYILLTKVSGVRTYTHSGQDITVSSRVQFDLDAATNAEVISLRDAVRDLLSGYKDFNSGGWFQGIFLESERGEFEGAETIDDLYRISLDFMIIHKEK